jgi:hypothetical protein
MFAGAVAPKDLGLAALLADRAKGRGLLDIQTAAGRPIILLYEMPSSS